MAPARIPDFVVLLPGILGSVLQRDGKDVWAPTAGAALRALAGLGRSVRELAPLDDDWREKLDDGVVATRLVDDVHLVPGLWKIDGYGAVERLLHAGFNLDADQYLAFPYDWRRDVRASALRLAEETKHRLRRWREKSNNDAAQLVLVAHSMGGLVARYFVEALDGWKDTRSVVTMGTPFYGSVNAAEFLLKGLKVGLGPWEADLSDMLRSLTSVHQLVPYYQCVVVERNEPVTPAQANLPGWQPAWRDHLHSLVSELESETRRNRSNPQFAANPVVYRPIAGTDQPTKQAVAVRGSTVTFPMHRGGIDEGGDGTVPLLSAALAGTEDQRTFAPQQHSRLQTYRPMLDHLRGILTTQQFPRIDDLRSLRTTWFSYSGKDVYLHAEPVVVHVAAVSELDPDLVPEVRAELTITDRATAQSIHHRTVRVHRNATPVEVGPLPPGTYEIAVTGSRSDASVSDVFVVADPS